MNRNKYIFIILILFSTHYLFGQTNIVQSVKIEYVDFTTLTDMHVDCADFEKSFVYKEIEIRDRLILNQLVSYIAAFKKDSINNYLPDSRAKIFINYCTKKQDVICISNTDISYNSSLILLNTDFLNYIIDLIKRKDREFDY
ncbi:MAG: hypothetical protein ACM3UU_07135 [Ignavibacteriales bacterium]